MPDEATPTNTQTNPTEGGEGTDPTQHNNQNPTNQQEPGEGGDGSEGDDGTQNPISADIKKLLAKARKDERDKLYGQINNLKEEVGGLKKNNETMAQTLERLNKEYTEGNKPKGEGEEGKKGTPDIDKLVAVAVSNALERAEQEVFGPRISQLENSLKEADQKRTLESYKNRLIQENEGTIIPELLSGNSEEELDASLITSKQVFARTAQALNERLAKAKQNGNGNVPLPNINAGQSSASPGSQTSDLENAVHMTDAEWAEKRQQILKEASAAAMATMNSGQ